MNLRAIAAQLLVKVSAEGRSLSDCLTEKLPQLSDPRDQRFLQALCYGVCRWYHKLDEMAASFLDKPFKSKDHDIYCLILLGLYQLIDMRVAEHAAVAETVSATQTLKKPWAKGLINAVLRRYLRETAKTPSTAITTYSHPAWLIEKIQRDWPNEWQDILIANNQHPPFALRVNQKHLTRSQYLDILAENHQIAHPISYTHTGIYLETPCDVQTLPGFSRGQVSVQDGAAQLAAELLMLEPGLRVLDACAAPGGKTTHIAESSADLTIIAIDYDEERLQTVKDNCQRLQLSVESVCTDVGETDQWWDGELFDRILLDAPCSASGVIRRHPDIKLLRRETDIAALVQKQTRLLNAVWKTLKPGGLLVYATCSLFPEENHLLLQTFLTHTPDAREENIASAWGKPCSIGKQILPGMHGMDGFYYARLRKLRIVNTP